MCGIAGIIEKQGRMADAAQLRAMTDAVAHRGPDGQGQVVMGPVGLGHRRLAIVDLSPLGAQPMTYRDLGLTIVHNGEIYNYLELRSELQALGYAFQSETDTEVILAAYDAWGEECLQRFNGMWAFAIHDVKRNRVFCARDRFGVKPFYYHDASERLVFGSEIRQLLPFLPSVKANHDVVAQFMITGGNDLGSDTFFEGVKRLESGHALRYDLTTQIKHIYAYYTLARPTVTTPPSPEEASTALHDLLRDAVRLRLRSDVKVGTCLSGGLDSSTVATLAAGLTTGEAFAAITAVSEQASNNEADFARQVVEHSGLDWHTVQPTYADFVASLPAVVTTQEEPFGSASIVMQYWVMKTARANGVTVLLDGQGGDELLLGYERYYAAAMVAMLRSKGVRATLRMVRQMRRHNSKMNLRTILKYLLGGISSHLRYGYYCYGHRYLRHFPECPEFLRALARNVSNIWAMQALDVTTTNLPILLRFEDKNAMAHAIETRLPFLDYRVVEMALALPIDYKIHEGWSKWIVRNMMRSKMPEAIVWRKNKFGFEAPEDMWLAAHAETMRAVVMASPLIGALSHPSGLARVYPTLDARSKFRLYSVALWEAAFAVQV